MTVSPLDLRLISLFCSRLSDPNFWANALSGLQKSWLHMLKPTHWRAFIKGSIHCLYCAAGGRFIGPTIVGNQVTSPGDDAITIHGTYYTVGHPP